MERERERERTYNFTCCNAAARVLCLVVIHWLWSVWALAGLWLFCSEGSHHSCLWDSRKRKKFGLLIDVDVCHDGIDDGHQRETSLADCIELKYAQTDLLCSFYFIGWQGHFWNNLSERFIYLLNNFK
jgi:hypothetical protein